MFVDFVQTMVGTVPVGYESLEYVFSFLMAMVFVEMVLDMLFMPILNRKGRR